MDLLVLIAFAAIIFLILRGLRSKRCAGINAPADAIADSAAYGRWAALHHYAGVHRLDLLHIREVYARHHNGCKARVSIYGDGESPVRDAWFLAYRCAARFSGRGVGLGGVGAAYPTR